jgi:sirohydrochlorin ferrochelatase
VPRNDIASERGGARFGAGIVVFAHGSRVEAANEAVRAVARGLACAGEFERVEAAFLELGRPDLPEAVARLAGAGVKRVVVVPYFLTMGLHLERDLPRIVDDISRLHPDLEVQVTPPLDGHPGLVQVLLDRARAAG